MPSVNCCLMLVMLAASCLLSGCSQSDPASPTTSHVENRSASSESPVAEPTNDACSLLNDDEVSKAFPGAAAGKSDRSLESHGIHTCTWETPTDRFILQVFDSHSGSIKDELRSRMFGPMVAGPPGANAIRYEQVSGIGDDAMLVVEKADAQVGIVADTAIMVTERGERRAVLFAGSSLAGADRASARKTLETLARQVAAEL